MKNPNILLLTIDTLRADALGCYGHPKSISPEIDQLAEQGVMFEQAITSGSWTQAAFPVMLTSTYASMYGGCLGPLSPDRPSPVEALSRSGYQTAAFSTSPLLSRALGYDRGFNHFVDLDPEERDPVLRRIKGGHRLLGLPATHAVARLLRRQSRPARLYVPAEALTDQFLDWLPETDRPFFAWLHYMDVHWPYHLENELTRPVEIAQAWKDLRQLYQANWNGAPISPQQRRHFIELYEKAVRYTDSQIGRLLRALDRAGVLQNSIIILVSDHGEEFLERKHWGHFETNLHDEIVRVPLIFKLPEKPAVQRVTHQVSLLDLMPTILELGGCPAPDGMEGVSLIPLWNGDTSAYAPQVAISEMWRDHRHMIALRTREFKYIWDSEHPDQPALYFLSEDPEEQVNVIDQFPEVARDFQAQISAHLSRSASVQHAVDRPDLEHDDEILRRLRDLGYVE